MNKVNVCTLEHNFFLCITNYINDTLLTVTEKQLQIINVHHHNLPHYISTYTRTRVVVNILSHDSVNPLSPNSDQYQISLHNINAYSTPRCQNFLDILITSSQHFYKKSMRTR